MAIIKATPEALAIKGLLPALQVKYGTLVLRDIESFNGDGSGLMLDIQVFHKGHPWDHVLDLLIEDSEQGLIIHEK